MLWRIWRFTRVVYYTFTMYVVTHLMVLLYLFPIGTLRIILDRRSGYRVRKSVIGLLFRIIHKRLSVVGLDNIEPAKARLIVANYPGGYAGFALMKVFPDAAMLVHYLLARVPIVGFLLKSTGAVFVQHREFGKSERALDEALKLNDGRDIMVLPEGAPSRDGSIRSFRRGFIHILRRSSMDLQPVTLNGFYSLKPRYRPYLDPDAELEVVIHEPITHCTIAALSDKQLLEVTLSTIEGPYRP